MVNVQTNVHPNVHQKIINKIRVLVNMANVVNVFPFLFHARTRARPPARERPPENVHHVHNVHQPSKNQRVARVNVVVNVGSNVHPILKTRAAGGRRSYETPGP